MRKVADLGGGVVGLTEGQEVAAVVDENVLTCHEVGVTFDSGEVIEERKHLVEERLLVLSTTRGTKLGQICQ